MEVNLFIVPVLPDFAPDRPALQRAEDLISTFYWQAANDVSVQLHSNRRAVGSATNLGKLDCPECRCVLDVRSDDLDEWWSNLRDLLYASETPLTESVDMPCCKGKVSLDRLDFGEFIRFSRLVISVDDPSDGDELTAEQLFEIEDLLKCKLLQFKTFET